MNTATLEPLAPAHSSLWQIIQPATREGAYADAVPSVHPYGTAFNSEQALRILKRGISSRVIDPLSDYLEMGKGELAEILDLDRTTALRRAGKDQPLPTHSAENVLRVLELEEMATDTFETQAIALGWLRRPHPMLDGESPLQSAKTSFGTRRVKDMLVAIKHGGVV
ncbi:MAG: antitoxin Xre/MbcA/ParS toxin-binding domain-containing protein [Rhodoferax sp.]|uniref:antitoxin Xre/MbcA/ParS toxin-binding domain-containing protein n=1 Tax=Rhodoferax sp. TaxID=50421 RepID=UPI003267D489